MVQPWRFLFLAVFSFSLLLSSSVFALQVKSIQPSGSLKFENGEEVHLAGLIVPVDSFSLLSVLLSGKELQLEDENSKNYPLSDNGKPVYIFVKAKEMDFPFRPEDAPKESTIMVNQLLLSLGLARVDAQKDFKHREKFLKIEAEARVKGHGIWSYETPPQ